MEITNKKSVYQHIYLNIKLYKNNQDIIISTYILTSIIIKIKQDIINIYIFISYIMKINQDITSTDILFIILYQNNQKQSVYTITLQIAKNTIVLDFG